MEREWESGRGMERGGEDQSGRGGEREGKGDGERVGEEQSGRGMEREGERTRVGEEGREGRGPLSPVCVTL